MMVGVCLYTHECKPNFGTLHCNSKRDLMLIHHYNPPSICQDLPLLFENGNFLDKFFSLDDKTRMENLDLCANLH